MSSFIKYARRGDFQKIKEYSGGPLLSGFENREQYGGVSELANIFKNAYSSYKFGKPRKTEEGSSSAEVSVSIGKNKEMVFRLILVGDSWKVSGHDENSVK